MYQARLDRVLKDLDALRRYVIGSDALRLKVQAQAQEAGSGEADPDAWPDSTAWLTINHCNAFTRMYALFETYCLRVLEDYLSFLGEHFSYNSLTDDMRAAYRREIGELVRDINRERFKHLSLENVVGDYSKALGNEGVGFRLVPEAMLSHDQNLRVDELDRLCAQCGLPSLKAWLTRHRTLKAFFDAEARESDTAEAELKSLVDYRNNASHGSVESDGVVGVSTLVEYIDFTIAFVVAFYEFMNRRTLDKAVEIQHARQVGVITEKFANNIVVAVIAAGTLAKGECVVMASDTGCHVVTILNIQDNGQNVDSITTMTDKEVGLALSSEGYVRALIFVVKEDFLGAPEVPELGAPAEEMAEVQA